LNDVSGRSQQLFVVRLWQEPCSADVARSLRGSVEHVASGQRLYFAALSAMNAFVAAYLEEPPCPEEAGS
jgi:hypothetical protein